MNYCTGERGRVLQTRVLLVPFVQTYLSHRSYSIGSNSSSPLTHPCLTKDNLQRSTPALCVLVLDNSCATKRSPSFRFFPLCATNHITTNLM